MVRVCTVETFYSVLGVGRDADRQTVVRAYRDEVKSHHPDVSDRADATETFKRLTTAREVLADEARRSEYDRLGHEAYLRRHGCCGWSVDEVDDDEAADAEADPATAATASESSSPASRAARAHANGGSSARDATPREEPTRAASGGTATAYYRPGQRMNPGRTPTASGGLLSRFQSVGPWLLLDVILLASALATAWLIVSWLSVSALSVVLAVVLCVGALAATSLHLSVRAYA